jgi:hypothetical protein
VTCAAERRLEVVEPIWVALLAQDGRAIVIGERLFDSVNVVHEVEHEHVVLLRVRTIEA